MFRKKEKADEFKKKITYQQKANIEDTKVLNQITGEVKELMSIISKKVKENEDYYFIEEYIEKNQIRYLINLKKQLNQATYKCIIDSLQFACFPQTFTLITKSRKSSAVYILLEGKVSFYQENTNINSKHQFIHFYDSSIGSLIGAEALIKPKYSAYQIKTDSSSILLKLSEQIFNRYLKQLYLKQQQQIIQLLISIPLFQGICANSIKKYLGGFVQRHYRYKEKIYSQGQQSKLIFFIEEGEVQLLKETSKDKIKVVSLGKNQFFGLEYVKDQNNTVHMYSAQVASNQFKVISIHQTIFHKIAMQNTKTYSNLQFYIKRADQLHHQLFKQNNAILNNHEDLLSKLRRKKNKKNKRGKRKVEISLEWWGLASKFVNSRKYKMPCLPPKSKSQQKIHRQPIERPNFQKNIQQFRKRVLNAEIKDFVQQNGRMIESKQNQSPFKVHCVPKGKKIKIQMIDTNPKAVDTTEMAKKKLISYAKYQGNFCERLDFQ